MRMELHRAVGGHAFLDEGAEGFANLDRVLAVDEAERNLGGSLCGDDCLEAFSGIAAGNAVDFRRWARPCQFQHAAAFLTGRDGKSNRTEEIFRRAAEAFP